MLRHVRVCLALAPGLALCSCMNKGNVGLFFFFSDVKIKVAVGLLSIVNEFLSVKHLEAHATTEIATV